MKGGSRWYNTNVKIYVVLNMYKNTDLTIAEWSTILTCKVVCDLWWVNSSFVDHHMRQPTPHIGVLLKFFCCKSISKILCHPQWHTWGQDITVLTQSLHILICTTTKLNASVLTSKHSIKNKKISNWSTWKQNWKIPLEKKGMFQFYN